MEFSRIGREVACLQLRCEGVEVSGNTRPSRQEPSDNMEPNSARVYQKRRGNEHLLKYTLQGVPEGLPRFCERIGCSGRSSQGNGSYKVRPGADG
jgi:hypothetical protein